tara:strand:+ start:2604 stop:3266 length:663 start_codon:yes stop_codon:yes gene_type:complete
MEEDIYFKQKKLFNPHDSQPKIFIYGVGSIGSHVAVGLAKIGMNRIKVYDYDKLEPSNLPAQFYPVKYLSSLKTEELRNMVLTMTGTLVETEKVMISTEFNPELDMSSIHIIAFDNIEARKIIWGKLLGYPVHFIDGRIGGFNFEKYYLNMNEDKNLEEYKQTLSGEFSDLECGEKCLWAVNSLIASKIIADVVKIVQRRKPSFMHKGNLMSDITITKED